MRHVLICLPLLLAACASGGDWPSLAHRPGEDVAQTPCGGDAAPAVTETVPVAKAPPLPPAVPVIDVAVLGAELDAAKAAWRTQLGVANAAVDSAQGYGEGSERWGTAHLELSRLGQTGAKFADIGDKLRADTLPDDAMTSTPASVLRANAASAYDAHLAALDALRQRLAR